MPPAARRRSSNAGGILTESGCQRLRAAIDADCARSQLRPSYDKIAARAGLPADAAIAILYRQAPHPLTDLEALYSAFQLELADRDYTTAELEPPPAPPPRDRDADLQQTAGRQALLADLAAALQSDCRLVIVTGAPGSGKSTLLRQLQAKLPAAPPWTLLDADQQPLSALALARALLGEAAANARVRPDSETLPATVLSLALAEQPGGLAVDTAEQVLADSQPLASLHQLVLQVARADEVGRRLAIATPHLPAAWQAIAAQPWARWLPLAGLSTAECVALFQTWGLELSAAADQQSLATMVSVYQGNPLALKLIAGEIRAYPYWGNLQAYWHDCGSEYVLDAADGETAEPAAPADRTPWLRALVESALRRLAQHDRLAYQLLCLGAANPDPSPAAAWQFLIGDLPAERQQQALVGLQQRFWLEALPARTGCHYRVASFIRKIVLDQLPPPTPSP